MNSSIVHRAMSSANMKDEFDPSWSQIGNFITFLNAQLSDCEESIFCRFGGNDFKGFKEFIVRFSIVMAKVKNIYIYDHFMLNIFNHRNLLNHLWTLEKDLRMFLNQI